MTRTLNVDELTEQLQEQTVTIAGTEYRLVVKDNKTQRKLRDDSRELAKLGRRSDEIAARAAKLDENKGDEAAYEQLAGEEEALEDRVVLLRRQMIGQLIRDADGKPPAAGVLDGLDAAVIGRLFEFVLADPLAADPTGPTANGGDTPPTSSGTAA